MWKKHYTIKEASEYLGISSQTLRNWDKKGLLTAFRHPMNNYRLYRVADLEKLIRKTEKSRQRKLKVQLIEE